MWAMIQLQMVTGMRPTEVCIMRGCDIDTTREIWTYTPASHKTQHHGHRREIYLGPKARQIIEPFLAGRATDAYLFSPAEAEAELDRAMTLAPDSFEAYFFAGRCQRARGDRVGAIVVHEAADAVAGAGRRLRGRRRGGSRPQRRRAHLAPPGVAYTRVRMMDGVRPATPGGTSSRQRRCWARCRWTRTSGPASIR